MRAIIRACAVNLALFSLIGCEQEPPPASSDPCEAEAEPPARSEDWCARMPGGPAGAHAAAVDLSALHALVRFFSSIDSVVTADEALVLALADDGALETGDVSAYADAFPGTVCVGTASSETDMPSARVEMSGAVAWVHPGTGALDIPSDADAVMIDLRGLPDVPELAAALAVAVGAALKDDVRLLDERIRAHHGLVDEVFSEMNAYTAGPMVVDGALVVGAASRARPLAVLTDAVMPPDAAALALALRLKGRAFLVGEDVRADVAESRWQGVADAGAYVRIRELVVDSAPIGDVVSADRRSTMPECAAAELLSASSPEAIEPGVGTRPAMIALQTYGLVRESGASLEEAQAAVLIVHAALRRFFPYFAVVGDGIDERVLEVLGSLVEPLDRDTVRNSLRRFGEVLHDGHNFVSVYGVTPPEGAGFMPVVLEDIDGELVVRRSAAVGVEAGDTLVAIGGTPVSEFLAVELARTSAASSGYQLDIAARSLVRSEGPTSVVLRAPDDVEREITFTPQPLEDFVALGFAASMRPEGFLDDLGAPAIYFLNMDSSVLTTDAQLNAAMQDAMGADGLILDMRGYPGINHYAAASRLITEDFASPTFVVPEAFGADVVVPHVSHYDLSSLDAYQGPIVLLVGHHSVSAAENFSTMLVDAGRVTVVGRNSAATNGNITGVQLPGGYSFSFTGMEVLHSDGSTFHGIGIRPESETVLSAAAFAAGEDPELQEAIAVLQP